MDGSEILMTVGLVLIGLPWLVLHYLTKWKTAATLTNDDESLLEELFQLAKRLDDRMDTVERLVAADHPEIEQMRTAGRLPGRDEVLDDELDEFRSSRRSKTRN
jgi:phage shock protein B